jgi:hypothetical protein
MDPWTISAADYPAGADAAQRLRFLLGYAILAPSSHNTQPWRFKIEGRTVELHADRSRALPVVDPDGRELIISCGAALETLLIAMRHFSLDGVVQPGDGDLLARIVLEDGEAPSPDEEALFAAITQRHTDRHAFYDRRVPDELTERLVADTVDRAAWLAVVPEHGRGRVADLIAAGDRKQMADPRFRRELAAWIRPNRSRHRDGMRGYGLGFGALMSAVAPLGIRAFDAGPRQAQKDRELALAAPLLAVFGTNADTPADWLNTGRALQRTLLRARAAGAAASHFNQPVEIPALRHDLAQAIGRPAEFPQLLVRFGYGPGAKPQPRRA